MITLAGGLALLVHRVGTAGDVLVLVTQEQFELEQRERSRRAANGLLLDDSPPPRKRGLFPVIRVLAPKSDSGEVASPLRMEISFETSRDARIVPQTFRLLYGLMRFDLTEIIRRGATLTERGLVIERAAVPPGTHRLLLQIADDRGRVNEQELRLRIAA